MSLQLISDVSTFPPLTSALLKHPFPYLFSSTSSLTLLGVGGMGLRSLGSPQGSYREVNPFPRQDKNARDNSLTFRACCYCARPRTDFPSLPILSLYPRIIPPRTTSHRRAPAARTGLAYRLSFRPRTQPPPNPSQYRQYDHDSATVRCAR